MSCFIGFFAFAIATPFFAFFLQRAIERAGISCLSNSKSHEETVRVLAEASRGWILVVAGSMLCTVVLGMVEIDFSRLMMLSMSVLATMMILVFCMLPVAFGQSRHHFEAIMK